MKAIYSHRDLIAVVPAAALLLALIWQAQKEAAHPRPKRDDPVKIAIVKLSDLIPEPPAPPAEPRPPEPIREPQPPAPAPPRQTPRRSPQVAPAKSVPAPQAVPAPAAAAPTAAPPEAPLKPAAPAAAAAPPLAAQAHPNADAEAEYVARVRAYLNSIKRYPTGREASTQRPRGVVKLWLVLRRDGSVVDAGVEESSNSSLLDEAARKTAMRGNFPAFPDQFKPAEGTHRFTVDLQFTPAG